jgi:hypothetical protein
MRGILFVAALGFALAAAIVSANPALAGAGVLGPAPWGLWAIVLFLIHLAPERGPNREEQVEVAFLAAAHLEAQEALQAWPEWEGFVPPILSTDEPDVRFVSDGVEVCDELLRERSSGIATLSGRQKLAIAQQRAIKAELARPDLTPEEMFNLGLALLAARKGLLA